MVRDGKILKVNEKELIEVINIRSLLFFWIALVIQNVNAPQISTHMNWIAIPEVGAGGGVN